MNIKMISGPILLFETIAMICRYYRRESYIVAAERLLSRFGGALTSVQKSDLARNGAIAEKLMNEICFDIDLESKDIKFFFKPFDTGEEPERNCIAKVLVFSVLALKPMSFDESVRQIKEGWSEVKREGICVLHFHMHGLNFTGANGRDLPSLFEQIYSMDYPLKAKLDSYRVIDRHEVYMDKLAELVRPYAKRLEAAWERLAPIYAVADDYWELSLSVMTSRQVAALMRIDEKAPLKMLSKAYVSIFLFNEIGNSYDDLLTISPEDITTIYIGMAIYPEYTMVLAEQRLLRISEVLRALADTTRMDILARLNKEADYCLSLAQNMELNTGNVSRHLAILHENSIVSREKRDGRIYFKTDMEVIERTFANYMSYIMD